jgi:hypothetical protein
MLVLWGLVWLRFPEPPTPFWRGFPLPGLLVVGGAGLGLLLALVGRRLAAVGARRRGRRARQSLADEVTVVMNRDVVEPVDAELEQLAALRRAAERL